jgi:16S rRNA (guanine(1405)-N(7))-methyltransferase
MKKTETKEIAQLTAFVLKKKKYQQIDAGLIEEIARQELNKGRKHKETQKAILAKLHQVGAAYFEQTPEYAMWEGTLSTLTDDLQAQTTRDFCIRLMAHHHSTHERQYILENFFQETLAAIQPIPSILDLACGLNPLALPWMPIERDVKYFGCDIFKDMTNFLQNFADHFHIQGNFRTCNVFDLQFTQKAKVAFLLKTLPCLEQVKKGFAPDLLRAIPAEYILVSYPISSLSGKSKGMQETYTSQFMELMDELQWPFESFTFSSEIAFLIEKQ